MKIGLYFGSFNPIHLGHLIIAGHVLNECDIKKVWFVVSPQNPLKPALGLLHENHRIRLVRLAIEDDYRLQASNVEFDLPRPSYTIDTLTYLKEKHPSHQFSIIMGSDSFTNLPRWKNFELILSNHSIIVYKRPGFDIGGNSHSKNISVLSTPLLDISSTHIRKLIKESKDIRYLVPDKVREAIDGAGYFK